MDRAKRLAACCAAAALLVGCELIVEPIDGAVHVTFDIEAPGELYIDVSWALVDPHGSVDCDRVGAAWVTMAPEQHGSRVDDLLPCRDGAGAVRGLDENSYLLRPSLLDAQKRLLLSNPEFEFEVVARSPNVLGPIRFDVSSLLVGVPDLAQPPADLALDLAVPD